MRERPLGHRRRLRRRPRDLWSRLRRLSRLVVWGLVVLVAASLVAYFALALPPAPAR